LEPGTARMLARESHAGQCSRFGEPVIEHVQRVAAAVPPEARTTALLHDLLELSPISRTDLHGHGVSRVELEALALLTHCPAEPYDVYVRKIADAPGPAGQLARTVKLADLDDHLAHATIPSGAPPYAWAKWRLLTGRDLVVQPAPASDADTTDSGQRRRTTVHALRPPTPRLRDVQGNSARPPEERKPCP
jgi:hypothetical protein